MSTPIVATILLQHRKGISQDDVVNKATWIYEEIKARGGELSVTTPPSSTSVQSSLKYLEGFVDRKRNIFEPLVSAKKSYKNIIMLAYYRNNMIHLFVNEAIIACSVLGLGSIVDSVKGIPLDKIWEKTQFLANLFSEEFLQSNLIKTKDEFMRCVEFMAKRNFL
jgi:glycerol-3-phosphate O-acyltransferase